MTFAGRDAFIRASRDAGPTGSGAGWTDELYRRMRPRKLPRAEEGTVKVSLIPCYAWANRGRAYMEVWIPLAR